jgi:hypothetical protein
MNNPDVSTSTKVCQQAKMNDLIEKLEKAKAIVIGYELIYGWTLAKDYLPHRDNSCLANASKPVEVLYVGPFHSDGTYDIYRGSMSRYLFDKQEWECSVHNNLRQTFEDIGYSVVAWRYYDLIPDEIETAIRTNLEVK